MIHNLSFPYSPLAVNSNISDEDATVRYSTIKDAINLLQLCGNGAFMAISDIAVPLNPNQYHLINCFFWNGFYYDKVLLKVADLHVKFLNQFLPHFCGS